LLEYESVDRRTENEDWVEKTLKQIEREVECIS